MKQIHALVAGGAVLLASGCGQKGPLVLPDAVHAHKKVSMPHATPAPSATPTPGATASPGVTPGGTPATDAPAGPPGSVAPDAAPTNP